MLLSEIVPATATASHQGMSVNCEIQMAFAQDECLGGQDIHTEIYICRIYIQRYTFAGYTDTVHTEICICRIYIQSLISTVQQ